MGRRPSITLPREAEQIKSLPLEDLSDIKEAADSLGVSTKTIRRYIQAGKINAHKIRNIWFVPMDEVKKLLKLKEEEAEKVAPMFDEITDVLSRISNKIEHIETRLDSLAGPATPEISQANAKIATLEEENRAYRDEIYEMKEELAGVRAESSSIATQSIKTRADEVEALRATITSNERGLALLRDEVKEKDNVIREREEEILQLLEKLKEMENLRKPAVFHETKKPGLFGPAAKSGPVGTGRP